jgi:hypothetical protein
MLFIVVHRFLSEAYETIRCELFWPWSWDTTWKGMKQGFSFILMILGLFIIAQSLFPPIVADASKCHSSISIVTGSDLGSVFSKHGKLDHSILPPI